MGKRVVVPVVVPAVAVVVVVAVVVCLVLSIRGNSSIMKVKWERLSLALFSVLLTCWLLGR